MDKANAIHDLKPLVLSLNIEVYPEDELLLKGDKPGDVVFQISCVFYRLKSTTFDKYLLSLGNPQENVVGATILKYTNEKSLLMGFEDLINEKNPRIIIGYDIFSFDIPYLVHRANYHSIYGGLSQCFPQNGRRFYLDLYVEVKKLYKYRFKSYSFTSILNYFGETRDTLDLSFMFKCYKEGIKDDGENASTYMSIYGKHSVQDSVLVAKLLTKLLEEWFYLYEYPYGFHLVFNKK